MSRTSKTHPALPPSSADSELWGGKLHYEDGESAEVLLARFVEIFVRFIATPRENPSPEQLQRQGVFAGLLEAQARSPGSLMPHFVRRQGNSSRRAWVYAIGGSECQVLYEEMFRADGPAERIVREWKQLEDEREGAGALPRAKAPARGKQTANGARSRSPSQLSPREEDETQAQGQGMGPGRQPKKVRGMGSVSQAPAVSEGPDPIWPAYRPRDRTVSKSLRRGVADPAESLEDGAAEAPAGPDVPGDASEGRTLPSATRPIPHAQAQDHGHGQGGRTARSVARPAQVLGLGGLDALAEAAEMLG